MFFGFSEEEKMIKRSVNDLFRYEFPVEKVRKFMDDQVLSRQLHKQISEMGIVGMLAKNGMKREGIMPLLAVFEEAGRALLPYPLLENVLGAYALSMDASKPSLSERIVEGKDIVTIAWENNGNPYALFKNGEYVANGSFFGVPFAEDADYILAFFRIQGTDASPSKENAMVIVKGKHPNVHVTKTQTMDQTYPLYNIEITNYPFSADDVVISFGSGTALKEELTDLAALFTSAEMLGMSDEMLYKTVDYTKVRKQFGQEIARFQILKHMAADMYVMLESSRVAILYAGWACEKGVEREAVSIAKAYTSDSATKITGMSIQMHGGIGFTWESDVHLYFKRARRTASLFGDIYTHRERLIKHLEKEVV